MKFKLFLIFVLLLTFAYAQNMDDDMQERKIGRCVITDDGYTCEFRSDQVIVEAICTAQQEGTLCVGIK